MTRSGQCRGAFVTLDERAVYAHVLGQVIRRRRGELPQADLALASGLSASALSRFELGQSQPDVYELRRLALALGSDAVTLVALVERALAWALHAAGRVGVTADAVGGLAQMAAAVVAESAAPGAPDAISSSP
jgi:hypothetical protein